MPGRLTLLAALIPTLTLTAVPAAPTARGHAGRSPGHQQPERRHTLMPVPRSVKWGDGALRLDSTATFGITAFADDRLRGAVLRAIDRLESRTAVHISHSIEQLTVSPTIVVEVASAGQRVQSVDEDESYSLSVRPEGVTLRAPTVVGALRGLQSLLQLVESDRTGFFLPAVEIDDAPRFRWRGLLLDVGRHFMPVETVKRTLDGMAAVKLNVFHWHLTEDQGFRVESRLFPRLHTMGSDGLFYTQEQIRDVVRYARDRGIRVLPEFDMPGHATSWFVGHPELASLPGEFEIWRGFGFGLAAFDPTREEVYEFIDRFIGEMVELFPDPYWHVGGDEVNPRHWDGNPRIRAFRRERGMRTNAELQAYFNVRLTRILERHGRRMVGWDEILHRALPKSTVVQSWRGTQYLGGATAQGFASLLSAPYYLDHIRSAEEHYAADPIPPWTELTSAQQDLVLGGEACMWTEHVTPETVDSRIWPRLAAVAERFWSPREVIQVNDMYRRLDVMSQRLEDLGLGHLSHVDRMVRRVAADGPTRRALSTVLEALAPPTFGQRVRGQAGTQFTPLVRVIDAAVPDPPGRWEASMLVDRIVSDTFAVPARIDTTLSVAAARERLIGLLVRWRDAGVLVRNGADNAPLVMEAVPASEALARVAAIGLEALGFLGNGDSAPSTWAASATAELTRYEVPHNLLRVAIVQPVLRLVSSVGGS